MTSTMVHCHNYLKLQVDSSRPNYAVGVICYIAFRGRSDKVNLTLFQSSPVFCAIIAIRVSLTCLVWLLSSALYIGCQRAYGTT